MKTEHKMTIIPTKVRLFSFFYFLIFLIFLLLKWILFIHVNQLLFSEFAAVTFLGFLLIFSSFCFLLERFRFHYLYLLNIFYHCCCFLTPFTWIISTRRYQFIRCFRLKIYKVWVRASFLFSRLNTPCFFST